MFLQWIKLSRCPSSWRHSNQTWRSLPASTNKKFARTHSSGFSSRKCVPPSELTHLPAGKGFWSEMLGVGDFYYELGVQIIEVCLALKHRNGGLITLDELHQRVLKGRGKYAQDVSQDDLMRAIKKLKVMGNGFGMIPVGGSYLVQSVPAELNMDHTVVLQLAEKKGYVTVGEIKESLKWEKERACHVLDHLLKEGLAWLDAQAAGEAQYWLPALFSELTSCDVTPEEANQMTP
ncbi:vacuolar-sorting protein SNF8 isoform X3 [Hippoglossus hippoglossus]|uniref:vacuolar-sorting protein SNF8 isoform X3 n=1 Tax=Hippoglossus hippoglossus TaxID=8267 RepID=UPI00148E3AB5|nr:vacuolar-sorting protein SNF8 isoform X3 [Hippoglossus hippoglossus]